MAYAYYASVVIQNGKVADDHSSFPILVAGTFDGTGGEADLRTTGNGGEIQNTDASGGVSGGYTVPADFVFSPNTDGSSEYDFEIEKYDAATGEIIAWVEIPTMDADADVTFYMVYGDVGVTTSQEDVGGTWDANYKAVYHMAEASGNILDSSGNGHDGDTVTGSPSYRQAGSFGYAIDFDAASQTDGFEVPDHADFTVTDYTLEVVTNPDATDPAAHENLTDKFDAASDDGFKLRLLSTASGKWVHVNYVATNYADAQGGDGDVTGGWEYLAGLRDGETVKLYVGAAVQADTGTNAGEIDSSDKFIIGYRYDNSSGFNGLIEEVRFSNSVRSANWITTTDNSFDVSTFLVFGAETAHATIIEVPLGTLTITGLVPTVSPLNLDVPLGTLSITGLVPTFAPEINFDVPLGTLTITGFAPLVGDETLHIRTADGTTLLGSVTAGDGTAVFSDGGTWYSFPLFTTKARGSFYGEHIGWSQANAVQDTDYNISDNTINGGTSNQVTHDGSGKLTVSKSGLYLIAWGLVYECNAANKHIEAGIEINGSGTHEIKGCQHVETKFANQEETLSGTGLIYLYADDYIELAIGTTDAGTPTISVQDIDLTMVEV